MPAEKVEVSVVYISFIERGSVAQKKGYGFIQLRLGKLYMIDASIISLCLFRYPWAKIRKPTVFKIRSTFYNLP